jgi:hypothetical protein
VIKIDELLFCVLSAMQFFKSELSLLLAVQVIQLGFSPCFNP